MVAESTLATCGIAVRGWERGGGGALVGDGRSVAPAKVFCSQSLLARSGSMLPSGSGLIRLDAIALRTALSEQPRIRAYARIEIPIMKLSASERSDYETTGFAFHSGCPYFWAIREHST